MNVLEALIQICKMANATSVVLTENDIPGAALERRKLAKLKRRSQSSLELVVLGAIMNTYSVLFTRYRH